MGQGCHTLRSINDPVYPQAGEEKKKTGKENGWNNWDGRKITKTLEVKFLVAAFVGGMSSGETYRGELSGSCVVATWVIRC